MPLSARIGAAFLLFILSPISFAQAKTVVSVHPISPEEHAALLATYKSSSEGKIGGEGTALRLRYTTPTPLRSLIVKFATEQGFDPADLVGFTMPAASDGEVIVDLTGLPGWSPGTAQYLLSFYSSELEGAAQVTEVEIMKGSPMDTARAALSQFMQPEDFKVSSYHMLRGYRILGVPLILIIGIPGIILTGALFWRRKPVLALMILLIANLLYSTRVSADLLRFSAEHLGEWYAKGTYDQAGSMHEIATWVRRNLPSTSHIFVCHDSTDYYSKVLRMFAYPIRVTATPTIALPPTHVLITRKLSWSIEEGILSCGPLKVAAEERARFSDGSVLFALNIP
jgi:hypothetical protein